MSVYGVKCHHLRLSFTRMCHGPGLSNHPTQHPTWSLTRLTVRSRHDFAVWHVGTPSNAKEAQVPSNQAKLSLTKVLSMPVGLDWAADGWQGLEQHATPAESTLSSQSLEVRRLLQRKPMSTYNHPSLSFTRFAFVQGPSRHLADHCENAINVMNQHLMPCRGVLVVHVEHRWQGHVLIKVGCCCYQAILKEIHVQPQTIPVFQSKIFKWNTVGFCILAVHEAVDSSNSPALWSSRCPPSKLYHNEPSAVKSMA